MELESEGLDFEALLSVGRVEVLQSVSVEHLRLSLGKISRDLTLLSKGPSPDDVSALRTELTSLRNELQDSRTQTHLQLEQFKQQQDDFGELLARLEKSEQERLQVMEQLSLARLNSRTDSSSTQRKSILSRKSSKMEPAQASGLPLVAILDAVDTLVDERLSFAIAGDAPLLLSNMAASVDTMAEQLTTLNDEKDSWKRQMSKAISLPGLSGGLEGIAEEDSNQVMREHLIKQDSRKSNDLPSNVDYARNMSSRKSSIISQEGLEQSSSRRSTKARASLRRTSEVVLAQAGNQLLSERLDQIEERMARYSRKGSIIPRVEAFPGLQEQLQQDMGQHLNIANEALHHLLVQHVRRGSGTLEDEQQAVRQSERLLQQLDNLCSPSSDQQYGKRNSVQASDSNMDLLREAVELIAHATQVVAFKQLELPIDSLSRPQLTETAPEPAVPMSQSTSSAPSQLPTSRSPISQELESVVVPSIRVGSASTTGSDVEGLEKPFVLSPQSQSSRIANTASECEHKPLSADASNAFGAQPAARASLVKINENATVDQEPEDVQLVVETKVVHDIDTAAIAKTSSRGSEQTDKEIEIVEPVATDKSLSVSSTLDASETKEPKTEEASKIDETPRSTSRSQGSSADSTHQSKHNTQTSAPETPRVILDAPLSFAVQLDGLQEETTAASQSASPLTTHRPASSIARISIAQPSTSTDLTLEATGKSDHSDHTSPKATANLDVSSQEHSVTVSSEQGNSDIAAVDTEMDTVESALLVHALDTQTSDNVANLASAQNVELVTKEGLVLHSVPSKSSIDQQQDLSEAIGLATELSTPPSNDRTDWTGTVEVPVFIPHAAETLQQDDGVSIVQSQLVDTEYKHAPSRQTASTTTREHPDQEPDNHVLFSKESAVAALKEMLSSGLLYQMMPSPQPQLVKEIVERIPGDEKYAELLLRIQKELEVLKEKLAAGNLHTCGGEGLGYAVRKPLLGYSCIACDVSTSPAPVSKGRTTRVPAVSLPDTSVGPHIRKGGWRAVTSTRFSPSCK